MIQDKRGLIGKILFFIGLVILIILIILGITAYQGYRVYQKVQKEQKSMADNANIINQNIQNKKFSQEDCKRIDNLEISAINIKNEAEYACKNPIIKIAVKNILSTQEIQTPNGIIKISCDNLKPLYEQMQSSITPLKTICSNQSLMNQVINA